MNFERARSNMIEQQIRPARLVDPQVVDALYVVRREAFVPAQYLDLAFADLEIPLGHGQSMLKPSLEARVLQALGLRESDRVLEIGTGSGYSAALLAANAAQVISIERVPELALQAQKKLQEAGTSNVAVMAGEGLNGWAENQPYDAIVLSGAVPEVPAVLLAQLRPGGRLLAFVGEATLVQARRMTCIEPGVFATENLFETRVPALACTNQRGFAAGAYC